MANFCHLNVHSEYSLSVGAIRIKELVKKIKNLGQSAVALTDHGNMFGAIEFFDACKNQGIKPILGSQVYYAGGPASAQLLAEEMAQIGRDAFPLGLLATSKVGYHALIKIVSAGYLESSRIIPIVSSDHLEIHSQDIIALSGGVSGEFGRLVAKLVEINPDPLAAFKAPDETTRPLVEAILEHASFMQKIFGEQRYFIEISYNNLPEQKTLNPIMIYLARYLDLPLVATANAYYLDEDFATAHAVLTCIRNELTLSRIRHRRKDARFHLPSNEEMSALFADCPEALENTLKIAEQCQIELKFGSYYLPDFELGGEDVSEALRRLAKIGLEERLCFLRPQYGPNFTPEVEKSYWTRLDYELDTIIKMGFPGYFLIVQDFINWAKQHDIPVGPGRGSGAGSIVAYALKITDLDPIPLNLIFERFLNPERISMPDFDVDFCQWRRDEVIQYVTQKYTSQNVAQITTFGKLKAKAALRDVGRVLEISYSRVDRIAKLVPNELDITLQAALDQEPRIMEEAANDPMIKEMIDIALKVEGFSRHTSVHAAGVVISNGPMENYVPVYRAEGNALITQYEMKNAEKVGLIKFDFLGLKTLTVIKKAVDIIHKNRDPKFVIDKINLEDPRVYREISQGNTAAIFQLESSGMQSLCMKVKPSCFEDIIAVVALFRPGPLQSGMVDDFIECKHGRQEIKYLVPELESILKDTYGIIVYQEQVQKIAANLANYSLGEADLLRRAMGKKKPEEMAQQKSRFLEGCQQNSIDPKIADELFELMAKFAAYGFNKSHSAAYGLVSYQTAYLKTLFPEEFMAAIMTCDMDNTDKLTRYIEECKRLKFTVHRPDINLSIMEFGVPKPKTISFALAGIKGIGASSIQPLIDERDKKGPFTSLTDIAKRVDLQKVGKKTLELLTESGAFDTFGFARSLVNSIIPEMVRFSQHHHEAKQAGQGLLFGEDMDEETSQLCDWEEDLSKRIVAFDPMEWLLKEKKNLSVFISQHPCNLFPEDMQRFGRLKINQIPKAIGQKNQALVAFLSAITERKSKSGKRMVIFELEDDTGTTEAIMFQNEIPERLPQASTMVACQLSISKSFDGQGISVRVEKVLPLESVRKEIIKGVTLTLKTHHNELKENKTLLESIKKSLDQFPGKTPIRLVLELKDATVFLRPDRMEVGLSDQCLQALRNLSPRNLSISYS